MAPRFRITLQKLLFDYIEQGTLAKSGTSDFLARAEGQDATGTGNLIGAFGLGFYSSFLVADRVHVASIPPKTETNPDPVQYIFSSSAEDSSFEVFPDPRGNTLKRGTEITLHLKEDAAGYLETSRITDLVYVFHTEKCCTHINLSQQQALFVLFIVPDIPFYSENGGDSQ